MSQVPGPSRKPKLEKLEMLRGFAALYVFAGHFLGERVWDQAGGAGHLFRFGQEAVMLFFLISGFVVYYATERRGDRSFARYLVRRARRIYPIFLLALAIALAVAWGSPERNPADFSAGRILGNVFMLQDFADGKPGVWVSTLAGNLPLWSLSYEWWFYLLFFPLWRFVPEGRRVHVAGVVSLAGMAVLQVWPNQAAWFATYFIVWWTGAEMARTYLRGERPSWRTEWRSLAYLGVVAGWASALAALAWWRGEAPRLGLHPVLEARHLTASFVLALGALVWARLGWAGFGALFRCFAWAAPISYALYVFHLPLAVNADFFEGLAPAGLRWAAYAALALGAAWLAEVPLQNWINRRTAHWSEPEESPRARRG